MANRDPSVERALENLRVLVRQPVPDPVPRIVMSARVPDDLESEGFRSLSLFADEGRALDQLRHLLAADLRFEHMDSRHIERATWRFVCLSHLRKGRGIVDEFVSEHAQEPRDQWCFFPVHLLTTTTVVELQGASLLPKDDAPPAGWLIPPFDGEPLSVIRVAARGTSHRAMTTRSREVAEHALRVLRATLREDQFTPDQQLRYRLGNAAWFDDGASAWGMEPDQGWELELDEKLLAEARKAPLYELPVSPRNDVERRAKLALTWFEQAQLAVEPLLQLLFLFTALEAILGDKAGGLKGPYLALRRALLGLNTDGGFTHPARTFLLYDKVRSYAVHGEEAPDVSERVVTSFAWDVRRALNEFLEFARRENLQSRNKVRAALDADPRRENVIAGLLRDDPDLWGKYFDTASD
jgi:hypothetical protein